MVKSERHMAPIFVAIVSPFEYCSIPSSIDGFLLLLTALFGDYDYYISTVFCIVILFIFLSEYYEWRRRTDDY